MATGILADGQLPTGTGDLYTVPGGTTTYVRSFRVFNTNIASQTVNVFITPSGGSARQIARFVLAQYESADILFPGPMSAGDKFSGDTTTAAAIDYVISGIEDS